MTQGQNFDFRDRSFFMDRGGGAIWGGHSKKLGYKGGATPKICMSKGGGGGHPKIYEHLGNFAATIYV